MLDELLKEWEKSCINNFGETNFAPDGIMYRGEFKYTPEYNNVSRLESANGLEFSNWRSAPLRIVFVMKDQNRGGEDEEAWDVRTETGFVYSNQEQPYRAFFKNLMYTLYGIVNTTQDKLATFDFTDKDAIKLYGEYPLARINVKKEAGLSSVSNSTLAYYLERDKDFIKRQLLELDADLLICCGYSESVSDSGNLILNFIKDNCYPVKMIEGCEGWIYYDEASKKVCINAYHPSYNKSYSAMEESFDALMLNYQRFLKNHLDFPKKR